jgi:hypothetical protein
VTPGGILDHEGCEIRVNDHVKIRNCAGGFITNALGHESSHRVEAIDPHLGVRVRYSRGPWESPRATWFGAAGVVKIETISSVNDCYWTAVHDGCRHRR